MTCVYESHSITTVECSHKHIFTSMYFRNFHNKYVNTVTFQKEYNTKDVSDEPDKMDNPIFFIM